MLKREAVVSNDVQFIKEQCNRGMKRTLKTNTANSIAFVQLFKFFPCSHICLFLPIAVRTTWSTFCLIHFKHFLLLLHFCKVLFGGG